MAFTLINGSATKVVDTKKQADSLKERGWTVVGGSATASANPWDNYTVGGEPIYFGFWKDAAVGSFEHFLWLASADITSKKQAEKAFALRDTIGGALKENSLDLIGVSFVDTAPVEKEEGIVYILADGSAVLYNGLSDVEI